jgi:hypothetical protein
VVLLHLVLLAAVPVVLESTRKFLIYPQQMVIRDPDLAAAVVAA